MLDVKKMPSYALERFARAVDIVCTADDIPLRERMELITYWAYRYQQADMIDQLGAAILRCQSDELCYPTASTVIHKITGKIIPWNLNEKLY